VDYRKISKSLKMNEDKQKKLSKLWKEFYDLEFPHYTGGSDELLYISPEFADLDGYIAGLVSSYLKGADISQWSLYVDEEMNKRLDAINPRNQEEEKALKAFKDYKAILDEMMRLLIELTSKSKK